MDSLIDQKILIVATATELRLFRCQRNIRDNKLEIADIDLKIPSDNNIVNKIV
jgi:hypothetical protein